MPFLLKVTNSKTLREATVHHCGDMKEINLLHLCFVTALFLYVCYDKAINIWLIFFLIRFCEFSETQGMGMCLLILPSAL